MQHLFVKKFTCVSFALSTFVHYVVIVLFKLRLHGLFNKLFPMSRSSENSLAVAISLLTQELITQRHQREHDHNQAILKRLAEIERNIMSKITEFAAAQKAFNERQATAIDKVVTSVEGITGDLKTLNDKIEALQNSQGEVTPEDQVLLDELQTAGSELATKLETVSTALEALDAQTPPTPPTP